MNSTCVCMRIWLLPITIKIGPDPRPREYTLKTLLNAFVATLLLGNLGSIEAAPAQFSGKVTVKHGRFLLADPAAHVTVELRGDQVRQFVGKTVTVTGEIAVGATPVTGAGSVVLVSTIALADRAVAAGTGTKSGSSGALSGAKLGAIGIAATGGLIGGYAAGSLSGDEQPASRP